MISRPTPLLLALSTLAGCATAAAPPPSKDSFTVLEQRPAAARPGAPAVIEGGTIAPAPPPIAGGDLSDPIAYAARFRRNETCEQAARNALAVSRDKGWEVLRACVKRGHFTLLRRLLDGGWDAELQSRTDAGLLIVQVIAARGGDVYGDLNLIRQRRIPLFSLGPAVENPAIYKGRLVVLRAEITDIVVGARPTARLVEFGFGYAGQYADAGGIRIRESSSGSGSGSYKSSRNSTRHGERKSEGEFSGSYSGSSRSELGVEVKVFDNRAVETGREAMARLSKVDPFLEPGRQFLVLARFDGMREVPGEEEGEDARTLPVLSVIGYVEPSANIVE